MRKQSIEGWFGEFSSALDNIKRTGGPYFRV